jgi:hypothetical protein
LASQAKAAGEKRLFRGMGLGWELFVNELEIIVRRYGTGGNHNHVH